MREWLIFLSDIAAGSVRVTVCLFLISRLLSVKKPEKKSIAIGIVGVVVISILLLLIQLPDVSRMGFEMVWIAVCASRFQKAEGRISLFVGIFYEIAVSFWQFLLAAWLGVFFHSPTFLDNRTGNGQIAVWMLHILLMALVFFIFYRDITGKGAFRIASVIALAGYLAVLTLSEQTILAISDDTRNMWMILAIVLMMAVLVFHVNRQYEMEKELARLKSEQAELLERDYTTLNQAYAINAKLFHDFHHHIGVLRQLLSHKKQIEAVQYLDELYAPIQEITDTVWTGDETVDYLINSKMAVGAESQIPLQIQVEFPHHTNIRSADLCAILGNLLDNAIEAARQVPEPTQRFVSLTIRRINQMLVIKVENRFLTMPVEEDGLLKTTKEEGGLHGWGLKSAMAAAEKYDGMVQTSYTGNIFRTVATLSYHGMGGCSGGTAV